MNNAEAISTAIDTLTNADASMGERVAAADLLRTVRASPKQKVYKLYYGTSDTNAYIGQDISEMVREIGIDEAEEGEIYTIKIATMTQDELDALPEFEGF